MGSCTILTIAVNAYIWRDYLAEKELDDTATRLRSLREHPLEQMGADFTDQGDESSRGIFSIRGPGSLLIHRWRSRWCPIS